MELVRPRLIQINEAEENKTLLPAFRQRYYDSIHFSKQLIHKSVRLRNANVETLSKHFCTLEKLMKEKK